MNTFEKQAQHSLCARDRAFLRIAIALNVKGTFTYAVPKALEAEAGIGCRVLVYFNHRKVTGYVLEKLSQTGAPDPQAILQVSDPNPLFHEQTVPFFEWLADYYFCPIGKVIESALPGGINPKYYKTAWLTEKGLEALKRLPSHYESVRLLSWVKENPNKPLPQSVSEIRYLEKKGWLLIQDTVCRAQAGPLQRKFIKIKDDMDVTRLTGRELGSFNAKNEMAFLQMIGTGNPILLKEITGIFSNGTYLVRKWTQKGVLETGVTNVFRNPAGEVLSPPPEPDALHEQQEKAVNHIRRCLDKKSFSTHLLFGVTGSGKTEVYVHAVRYAFEAGCQAIILVPEIALAIYMEGLFRSRLGDRVAVYHSGLSRGERHDQWLRIVRGEVDLVIGARSALFAPLPNLGLIIVDEEHDSSYKQDSSPRYQARDAAVMRAKIEKAVVILGSGTPSVQSYQNTLSGRYHLLSMPQRVENRPLPDVEIIDMKPAEGTGTRTGIISPKLRKAIHETLNTGNQSLLFLNRRGFHRMFMCWACGKPVCCPDCDVALTFHLKENRLLCHYCGFSAKTDIKCPSCGNQKLRSYGFGTEKLEKDLNRYFPNARVARMDTDSTRKKGELFNILKRFSEHEIDILVGTQMITKGYDFPSVTLVGVIAAELSMGFPDFRAAERTFQILSQVAGRAGRGSLKGRAIIQTFDPHHYAIGAATVHDFIRFFQKEVDLRKQLGYPPFSHLAVLWLEGTSETNTSESAHHLSQSIRGILCQWPKRGKELQILGPVQAPISKLKGKYRWQILVKCKSVVLIRHLLNEVDKRVKGLMREKKVRLTVDIDPYQMI